MEYVYSANDGMVANNVSGGTVFMRPGEVWRADDPFVLARPDLFSRVPTVLHSTQGLSQLEPVPLGESKPATGQRKAPYYERARRA